jgi:aminoglycoside phosphotransferase (APT) family kinase protein
MPTEKRHDDEIPMDEARVRGLLRDQFPEWADLPLKEWDEHGTDHTLFRLGDDMVVRMPIRPFNGSPLEKQQVGREARWIPFIAPQLPLELPAQLGLGQPTDDYPWHWSIVRWIEGERLNDDNIEPLTAAVELAEFVRALHRIDPTGGPPAGKTTWGRGASLRPGADIVRDAIERARDLYDTAPLRAAWEEAVAAEEWDRDPVWFHGDLAGNLIVRDGHLVGVIDSAYGVGDPACDATPGWSLFTGSVRQRYFDELGLDAATITRAKGWILGPASYGLTYYANVPFLFEKTIQGIERALGD